MNFWQGLWTAIAGIFVALGAVMVMRLLSGLVAAIIALVAMQIFWNFVAANAFPTSGYIMESQDLVEVVTTLGAMLWAFTIGTQLPSIGR